MARGLSEMDRAILAALADGAGSQAELRKATGAKTPELAAAVRSLRWRGFIALDRLALNSALELVVAVEPEPLETTQAESVPEAALPPPLPAARSRPAAPLIALPKAEVESLTSYPPRAAPRTAELAIGAVEPLPPEFRREALRAQRSRQRIHQARAAGKGKSGELARWEAEKAAAEAARRADPLEQAKTKLRRRGLVVFAAEVSGGPRGKFVVGGRLLTEAELLAKAG